MAIFEYTTDGLQKLGETRFDSVGIKEREDLQRVLRDQIDVIAPDLLIISEEFSEWDESRRRIDLLAVDSTANLVVIELKRTEDGGHMELQAIRYAAMVSTMTFERAVCVYSNYLANRGNDADAEAELLSFLGWEEPKEDDFGNDVRIILVSADFSRELTTSVMWLAERNIDILCIRVKPYQHGDQLLLDVQQIIPLPEAEEYQVRLREKASQERAARQVQSDWSQRNLKFWSELLPKAKAVSPLHQNISPSKDNWIGTSNHSLWFNYALARNRGRVELYLGRDRAENKAIFAELEAKKEVIEREFGSELSWQHMGRKIGCRIASFTRVGRLDDESSWAAMQDEMIGLMQRLEKSLAPHIEHYRSGGKPVINAATQNE